MFPGDPSAPPELVYNCRCTLIYVYDVKASRENLRGKEKEEKPIASISTNEVKNYYGDIQTSVFMSDERRTHVREHHPNDYDKYIRFVQSAINDPIEILDDSKKPMTAMFIGETDDENINVIVKLAFKRDKDDRSFVVTMFPVGERSMKKIRKHNKQLYKKTDSSII